MADPLGFFPFKDNFKAILMVLNLIFHFFFFFLQWRGVTTKMFSALVYAFHVKRCKTHPLQNLF